MLVVRFCGACRVLRIVHHMLTESLPGVLPRTRVWGNESDAAPPSRGPRFNGAEEVHTGTSERTIWHILCRSKSQVLR